MADIWSKVKRSEVMAKIRSKDTTPEVLLRSLLHKSGYRFRLHKKDLPGSPDIVFPKYSTVIFVNGCFWHHHEGCRDGKIPKTRSDWWRSKLERNIKRDKKTNRLLRKLGWSVLVIWECEIKNHPDKVLSKFERLLHQ